MIYFPATIECNKDGCTKTAKIRMVFLGDSFSHNSWEIDNIPNGWRVSTERFGTYNHRCPEHNPNNEINEKTYGSSLNSQLESKAEIVNHTEQYGPPSF